jgi:predicted phage tail protein
MILLSAQPMIRVHRMLRPSNLRSLALVVVLGLGVLGLKVASHASMQAALSADNGHSSPAPDHPAATVHYRSVKLSWAASVPVGKLPRDAIVGYNVYRSTKSHDRNSKRINSALCASTSFTDPEVESGKTYFYVTRGVNAKGMESPPSNEAKVVIP